MDGFRRIELSECPNLGGFMNKDLFEGKWHEFKGKVKEKWGKLTDDDLKSINGKRESLLGKLQSYYGYAKDQAEKEITNIEKAYSKWKDKK